MKNNIQHIWSLIFIFPIKLYQLFISPMLPNTCRHLPTCSDYTIEAIQEFGVLKGIYKGTVRILRCSPLGTSGFDPVKK
jgi:putative membrane protein insertion efficiency factor